MNRSFKTCITGLIVLSVVLGIITYLLGLVLPAGFVSPAVPSMILFFLVITLLVHYILMKASGNNNGRKFVNAFMLATLVKFFVYLPVIFIYMYYNRDDLLPFVVGFFILYLCYTVFEVISILRLSKTK